MLGLASIKTVNVLKKQLADIQKKSFTPSVFWDTSGNTIPLFDFSNSNEIKTAVQSVPELASILNYLGKSFSLGKYQIVSNDKIIEKHDLYDLFKHPHPLYNESEHLQNVAENLLAYGVAYIYMNKAGVRTHGMYVIPSWSVKPFVGELTHKQLREATEIEEIIKHYEINTGTKKFNIEAESIIQVRLNTTANIKDKYLIFESPLKPLEKALMVTPAMYDSMQNLMNNGGMKGFISNKSTDSGAFVPVDPKDKDEVSKAFKRYGSKSNQQDIAFVNYDLNYIPITSRIRDMLLPEQQKMIKTIISDVLGFDTAILNNDAANKYANYKEARKSMFSETLIPASNNYSEAITNFLFDGRNEVINLDFTYLDVFSEDEKQKAETINIESQLIINLNTAVYNGQMLRSNAIEFLTLSGYDPINANKLINSKQNELL